MKSLEFITISLFIAISSCAQNTVKRKADPAAVALNNKAMALVQFSNDKDSVTKAVDLLDEATKIDSNYFLGYNNKFIFLNKLKEFDKAALTIDTMIELRPHAHDLYLMGGVAHERIGDTSKAKDYFEKSLTICNAVLDTMNTKNSDHDMLQMNKAINLIMLGDQAKGNDLMKQVYDRQTDDTFKEYLSSFMNKNKKELLELMTATDGSSSATAIPRQ